ncbi:MAG: hypothetical protein J4N75_12100 [Chloroflexi bacterium]|nr:hypothetical protein [Chloroflexota bacterium]MCI0802289.1 hypothetical protein [Chloroflexota bacterium]MCI0811962.1 hypothetical protein [Chloroflexota bacterium]MCI0829420.1 hypothetical protein [Chloroflexota bacterium]MCI0896946.1 hypothetical protein [Chloroflexota bacterium]
MPKPMDREARAGFLKMALEQPEMTCADTPIEILEAASAEAEPTPFMEEYFATGHAEWLALKHGRRISLPQNLIDRAILVLWNRACLLDTDRLLGQTSPDANKPFFSDEGLY